MPNIFSMEYKAKMPYVVCISKTINEYAQQNATFIHKYNKITSVVIMFCFPSLLLPTKDRIYNLKVTIQQGCFSREGKKKK